MRHKSELGVVSTKVIAIAGAAALIAACILYMYQDSKNNAEADSLISAALSAARQEKAQIDIEHNTEESEDDDSDDEDEEEDDDDATIEEIEHQPIEIQRGEYTFTATPDSNQLLVKIDTGNKMISPTMCNILRTKLTDVPWHDAFEKVFALDKLKNEERNIVTHDCPYETIPALRFYVKFDPPQQIVPDKLPEEKNLQSAPLPVVQSAPRVSSSPTVNTSSYSSGPSCPAGTSKTGSGGIATAGCKCNGSGETWNGKSCVAALCPVGSSRNASSKGDKTNVEGCRCNSTTPNWNGTRCVKQCSGNKVFDIVKGACVCPDHTVAKTNSPEFCVECNNTSDCYSGYECVSNKCVNAAEENNDCRWGVCQTCEEGNKRYNISEPVECNVGGLKGVCNGNGTCYPTQGRRCSSKDGCPKGQFCNYGGTFNSNKKQRGRFGQTANVCQIVSPQEFSYKKVTYYYNSKQDLQAWCRAANNKANCLWGYLSKAGAESWCASIGKRLLTKAEMSSVWNVLKTELPQTYKGYAYWVQEGVWIEGRKGELGFGTAHLDGYGGRGGVVCK